MTQHEAMRLGAVKAGRSVYALVRDMGMATQIVKCSANFHITARNFDRAETMIAHTKSEKPFLVILDLQACEAEAFRALKELRENADLKGIPAVGVVAQEKAMVKPEAEKAGCSRVYLKTEFHKELPNLITRYAI